MNQAEANNRKVSRILSRSSRTSFEQTGLHTFEIYSGDQAEIDAITDKICQKCSVISFRPVFVNNLCAVEIEVPRIIL